MENSYFNEALKNFTMNAACNDAIRHLTDKGLSCDEIKSRLSYPAPLSHIEKVQKEYLDIKRRLENPAENDEPVYEFIEEKDAYGRKSFRRVERKGT